MASPAPQHHAQGLPSISTLTDGLRPSSHRLSPEHVLQNEQLRDSGTWPQPNSKRKCALFHYPYSTRVESCHNAGLLRTLTYSPICWIPLRDPPPSQVNADSSSDNSANSGLQVHTLLNPDDSPSRHSIPNTPQSARLPTSATSAGSALPSINQGFHDSGNRGSAEYPPPMESRRSSVDSRVHQGFSNLYINNPTSPYESANGSQVSLAASLRRPNGQGPMSPLSGRSNIRSHPAAPRQAPPIMPVARMPGGPDPTAAKPTQGYAWAFPDQVIPEESRTSESGDSSTGVSRTNSFANSVRSSIFSTDSQLPPGQRRFDEGGWPALLTTAHPLKLRKTDPHSS